MIEALLAVGLAFFSPQVPADSIGTETIGGKVFIIHRVDEKETLYGISRRYGTTVTEILAHNEQADAGLTIGQVLRIPYHARQTTSTQGANSTHRVAEGETLYSISRMYGVTVDELKSWNNLSGNSLALGQSLTVRRGTKSTASAPAVTSVAGPPKGMHEVTSSETLYAISRQYGVAVSDLRKWNNLATNDLKIGQLLYVSPPATGQTQTPVATASAPVVQKKSAETPIATTPVNQKTTPAAAPAANTVTISEGVHDTDEIKQSGIAELIEGTEGNRKYLALHKTAPIGTILKVRNEMNNREVFVRVIGKLPDSALTDNLTIKISRSAYDRLGAIDARFRVEVTYYK